MPRKDRTGPPDHGGPSGGRARGRRQFETTVRVPKNRLDPFGQREQAVSFVKRKVDTPVGPNTGRLDFEAKDKGDHYEIRVRGYEHRAGPRGIDIAGRMADGFGLPGQADPGGADATQTGELGSGDFETTDLVGGLASRYSAVELRNIAHEYGVSFGQTANGRELAQRIVDRRPLAARRLVKG